MGVEVSEYFDVKARASFLDCNIPTSITILPYNFRSASEKSELCYQSIAYELRELFQENNISETPLEQEGERFLTLLQESEVTEWVLPVIFVSYSLVSQNPHLISLALNVISNYLTDWFKKMGGRMSGNVELSVVVETKNGTCKRVKYRGPIAGLDKVAEIVRATGSPQSRE